MREPKKYGLRKVKQKGYYRNIIKDGKIVGRTWIKPTKVRRKVVLNAWIKWREEEDARIALAEYNRILREQIKRWRTGWLRAEFIDRNTGHKFYYKDVLTFKQFVRMRKREERIDSIVKTLKKGYIKSIKYQRDRRSIREARELLEISIQKAESINMARELDKWVYKYTP